MTQEREELLISDVAETKGMLNRFLIEWDARKQTLASCLEVDTIGKKIDDHIANSKHRGTTAGMWVASGAAVIAAIAAIFGIKP
jgi:hypothetical protein